MKERFERRDLVFIAVCLVLGVLCLWFSIANFGRVNPEASIRFEDTRTDSRERAEALLDRMEVPPGDRRYAAVFSYDGEAKVYLERELGLERANEIMGSEILLWSWAHRWFRPMEKEEFRISLATTGELVSFHHLVDEEAPGARLSQEEARARALAFLDEFKDLDPTELKFVEGSSEDRPNRTDHTFVWERAGWKASDATYRHRVVVQGDEVAGCSEFLKVPEAWSRDYIALRSRNTAAGMVSSLGLVLTIVALIVIFLVHARRRNIRWKTALVFGAIAAGLTLLMLWNGFSIQLYGYQTTDTWVGFLLKQLFGSLGSAFAAGIGIFLVVAAGEALYRQRFGSFLSVRRMFTLRAVSTKRFFRGVLLGLALTPIFIAFQTAFYMIATRFGAWAPAEVPFDDILNTRFPWILVLFVGFMPAVSEEFLSRAFSIPFFEKIMRSRVAAIVVAAFIWGFGHSAYPNQPFYIRGLEVGLAGIIIGFLLYRYGLLPLLVWHYTVDAAYTALLLFRSGNAYFITSAAVGVGILLVPLAASLVLYFVRGGFEPAGALTNEAEGSAPVPERAPLPEPPPLPYRSHSGRAALVVLVLAVVLAVLAVMPVPEPGKWARLPMRGPQAEEVARDFLVSQGFDLEGRRTAWEVQKLSVGPDGEEYLLRSGGIETLDRVARDELGQVVWRVRYFRPEEKEEWNVWVDPRRGEVSGFAWVLSETAPGADLPKEEAREVAAAFSREQGLEIESWDLKESSSEKREARRDHTFVWESPDTEGLDEGRVRLEVGVLGDQPGSIGTFLKLPEAWIRESEEDNILSVALLWIRIALPSLLAIIGLFLMTRLAIRTRVAWEWALKAGAVLFAFAAAGALLSLAQLGNGYNTALSWHVYTTMNYVGILIRIVGVGLIIGLATLLIVAFFPQVRLAFRRADRTRLARDALLGGLLALAAGAAFLQLKSGASLLLPQRATIGGFSAPGFLHLPLPGLAELGSVALGILLTGAFVALLLIFWTRFLKRWWGRALLVVLLVPFFMSGDAGRPGEILLAALLSVVFIAGLWAVARFVLRDNPLAWAAAVLLIAGVPAAVGLLKQPETWFRLNGALVLVVVVLPLVWLALQARGGREAARAEEPTPLTPAGETGEEG